MYAYASRPAAVSRLRIRRPIAAWRVAVRRLVMGAAVFAITVVFMAQAVHGQGPAGYEQVTVRPGDTVWSIAAARYPGDDTRARVDEILKANGLQQPTVFPGEQLKVPAA